MELVFSIQNITAFLLVVFRSASILFFAPIYGGKAVPTMVKAVIALTMGFVFYDSIDPANLPDPSSVFELAFAMIGELLIGAAIAMLFQLINAVVYFGGHIFGMHMGLRIANVFDPSSDTSASVIGAFLNIVVALLLLTMDLHLIIIAHIEKSFEMVPPLTAVFRIGVFDVVIDIGIYFYSFAVQIVIPALGAMFFIEAIMGVMAKAASKLNILMLQFPIKIFAGIIFLAVVIKGLPQFTEMMIEFIIDHVEMLLNQLRP